MSDDICHLTTTFAMSDDIPLYSPTPLRVSQQNELLRSTPSVASIPFDIATPLPSPSLPNTAVKSVEQRDLPCYEWPRGRVSHERPCSPRSDDDSDEYYIPLPPSPCFSTCSSAWGDEEREFDSRRLPTPAPGEVAHFETRPALQEICSPYDSAVAYTSTEKDITVGVELEMILLDVKLKEDPFDKLCKALQSLYYRGLTCAPAMRYDHEMDEVADRTKFLVMGDDSIDSRVRKVEEETQEEQAFSGVESWTTLREKHKLMMGGLSLCKSENVHPELLSALQEFSALDPHEFWPETVAHRSISPPSRTSCRSSPQPNSDPSEDTASTPASSAWGANDWETQTFSSCSVLSSRPSTPVDYDGGSGSDTQWIRGAPVEFCTPILAHGSWRWTIPVLFEHLLARLKVHFNQTTGLHVHVGCGRGKRWSLQDLKQMAKAIMIFEGVLDHVHAPHRAHTAAWAISSTRYAPALEDLSTLEAVRRLEAAETFGDFLQLVGPEKFHKYNFACNASYGTVEFRQAEAHGDGARAAAWIELAVTFVAAAVAARNDEFEAWAAVVENEADPLRLGRDVWTRFGIPWAEMVPRVLAQCKETLDGLQERLERERMYALQQVEWREQEEAHRDAVHSISFI